MQCILKISISICLASKTFEFTYWDARTRYNNEICDESGRIVDFGGIEIDFNSLTSVVPINPAQVGGDD